MEECNSKINDQNNFFLAYKIQDRLISFIHCFIEENELEAKKKEDKIGWIKTIAISREYKNQRIGTELLEQVEKELSKKGVEFLYVKTRYEAEYYEKRGFEKFTIILKKSIK